MSKRQPTVVMAPDDPRHGTKNGYNNLGCRCDPCRAANTADCRERRKRAHQRPPTAQPQWTPIVGEIWRPVVGYESWYEVSNVGRVRSLDRTCTHWRGGPSVLRGKLRAPQSAARTGHKTVQLCKDGDQKRYFVHVLMLEAFVEPRPLGMEGCHNNGDPTDNRIENLRWDTPSSNRYDSVRHGTHPQASKTHCKRGHAFTPQNTYAASWPGGRSCRQCQLDKKAAQRATRRAA